MENRRYLRVKKRINIHESEPKQMDTSSIRINPLVQHTSRRLYEDRDKTGDIKFKIESEEIPAHKCVLAAFSPKYERQFYGHFDDKDIKLVELKEPNVTAVAFKEFLQFFYLNKVQLTHEHIEDVIFLAKESLVNEFYNECVKFLIETLSTDNVCQIYHLAILHELDELMVCCKNKIKANFLAVKETEGFLDSDRKIVSDILQLVSTMYRAIDIFDACILWAKHFCNENNKDAENSEHLRVAFGNALYNIRFGSMTIMDFMKCYRSYKNLFTDEEREEILFMIGNVPDITPKWFGKQTQTTENDCSGTPAKWDEEASIECSRIFAETPSPQSHAGICKVSFSCNQRVLMGAFFCSTLYGIFGGSTQKCMTVKIKIVEKNLDSSQSLDGKTLFMCESEQITFQNNQQACFKLQSPILIKSHIVYEIQIEFPDSIFLQGYEFRNEVCLDNETIVQFHDSSGPVTCLKLNRKCCLNGETGETLGSEPAIREGLCFKKN